MPKYRLPINGIRHHDFAGCLEVLYESAPGRRMSISIEHDNPQEKDAVIVYWGKRWVGYIRSGKDRETACSLIQQSGRSSLLGKIVDIDREHRILWIEIDTDSRAVNDRKHSSNVLSDWSFDGPTLPVDEELTRLDAMLSNLEMVLECQEPWDADMDEWLEYVETNLWRDISAETSDKVRNILLLLASKDDKDYARATGRLQYAVDYMGSPEVRRLQAQQILDKSKSIDMDILLFTYGDNAHDKIQRLPDEVVALFMRDGEQFMGWLWYLHRPFQQVRAIMTLLSMMVRLKDKDGDEASDAIPRAWMMKWAKDSADQNCANVVKDMLKDYELERTSPALLGELRAITASEEETALADANFDDALVGSLMPIFKNNRHEVKLFLSKIDGARPTFVVEEVNRLLREGKVTKAGCKGDMWNILNGYKLYKPGMKNWNSQVNA